MKKLLTGIFIFGCAIMASGQNINNYKYIIIPESFEFTEGVDQYRLNSLTKFLFEKNGYNTLMKTEEKPGDLKNNPCLGLNATIKNNSNLFVTKLVLQLIDCGGNVVFETKEGNTREKDYETAYKEALRDAFGSVEEIEYNYVASTSLKKPSEKEIVSVPVSAQEQTIEKAEADEIMEEAPEVETQVGEVNESDKGFLFSGKNYRLQETAQGLGLFQESSSDPIAILIETGGGKSYIYNSLTNQGVAYFDEKGNLIVEYVNKQENKKVTLTYELKN